MGMIKLKLILQLMMQLLLKLVLHKEMQHLLLKMEKK
jgi:hypothetical protein